LIAYSGARYHGIPGHIKRHSWMIQMFVTALVVAALMLAYTRVELRKKSR
jgi:hypothetical protein